MYQEGITHCEFMKVGGGGGGGGGVCVGGTLLTCGKHSKSRKQICPTSDGQVQRKRGTLGQGEITPGIALYVNKSNNTDEHSCAGPTQ